MNTVYLTATVHRGRMTLYLNGRRTFSYRPSLWKRIRYWRRGWTLSAWAAIRNDALIVDEAAAFPVCHDEATEIRFWNLGEVGKS